MAFMGLWGTGVEPGMQYTEKVSCTVWKMMMNDKNREALRWGDLAIVSVLGGALFLCTATRGRCLCTYMRLATRCRAWVCVSASRCDGGHDKHSDTTPHCPHREETHTREEARHPRWGSPSSDGTLVRTLALVSVWHSVMLAARPVVREDQTNLPHLRSSQILHLFYYHFIYIYKSRSRDSANDLYELSI